MMDQEEVSLYASHRSWHRWRTTLLLRHTGYDFDVFGIGDDAESGDSRAPFMEEGDQGDQR